VPTEHQNTTIEPLVVAPRGACKMLTCGLTRFYEILPELDSYMDGRARRITVESIKRHIARKLAEARPLPRQTPRRVKPAKALEA
jgi:hypothetical protein